MWDKALTRFYYEFDWDGRELLLQSRAMDETGYVQPTKAELRKVRGVNSIYHNNGIQTWHVQEERRGGECRSFLAALRSRRSPSDCDRGRRIRSDEHLACGHEGHTQVCRRPGCKAARDWTPRHARGDRRLGHRRSARTEPGCPSARER